jgi:SAM-dependent methyltransferase
MRVAEERARVFGFEDRIDFYHGNAEELTSFVPLQAHDLVYSFGVIHHSPHPERILEEARHYLRPGGTLKLMVYNRRSWKVLWMLLRYGKGNFRRARQLIAEHSEAQFGSPVTYAYTHRELTDMLNRHGFRVSQVFVEHIFPWRVRDYVEYRYVKVWYFRWIPRRMFRRLERQFGWHLCATAVYEPQQEENA